MSRPPLRRLTNVQVVPPAGAGWGLAEGNGPGRRAGYPCMPHHGETLQRSCRLQPLPRLPAIRGGILFAQPAGRSKFVRHDDARAFGTDFVNTFADVLATIDHA